MREFPEANWPEWEIERKIGSGSFGSVYCIVREENGFQYRDALKVVNIPKSSDEISSMEAQGMNASSITEYCRSNALRFYNEINTLIQLGGVTNIVNYKDHKMVPKEDGIGYRIFIRMELLEPLNTYRKRHGMDQAEVLRLGSDIARALEYCEGQNIIHRDIKPDNIFVSNNGDFKLGDFGTARYMQNTNFGTIAGTMNYMAPEVYAHRPYDLRADIYSLGMVLFQYLSQGRLPFLPVGKQTLSADDVEQAFQRRMMGERIPEIPGIDPALSAVITHALEFDPEKRYASAREFRKALENPAAWYSSSVQAAVFSAAPSLAEETMNLRQGGLSGSNSAPYPGGMSGPGSVSYPGGLPGLGGLPADYPQGVCKICGTKLNPGASFCRKCGAKVSIMDMPPAKSQEKKKSWLPLILATSIGGLALIGLIVGLVIYFNQKGLQEDDTSWLSSVYSEINDEDAGSGGRNENKNAGTVNPDDGRDSDQPKPDQPEEPADSGSSDEGGEADDGNGAGSREEDTDEPGGEADEGGADDEGSSDEPEIIPMPAVNDIVLFGRYEQDNNTGNGAEQIRWQVIDTDEAGHRVLLLSEYSLQNLQYDSASESQVWTECSLRRWLNGDFCNDAFSNRELAVIVPVSVSDTYSFTDGNSAVSDRVFCLTKADVERLMPDPADRIAKNSDFAQEEMKRKMLTSWFYPNTEAEVNSTVAGWEAQYGVHCSWWWLRDPAGTGVTAWGVIRPDQVDRRDLNSVRPALWIDWDKATGNETGEEETQSYDFGGFGVIDGREDSKSRETVMLISMTGTPVKGGITLVPQCHDIYGTTYYNSIAGTESEFNNTVEYRLDGRFDTFTGTVIRDGEVNNGRLADPNRTDIVMTVYGDGERLYQSVSANLADGALQDFSVPVEGVNVLRIVINGKNFIRLCNAVLIGE